MQHNDLIDLMAGVQLPQSQWLWHGAIGLVFVLFCVFMGLFLFWLTLKVRSILARRQHPLVPMRYYSPQTKGGQAPADPPSITS